MLILSRHPGQKIMIRKDGKKSEEIVIEFLENYRGNQSKVAIHAPENYIINREEIQEKIDIGKSENVLKRIWGRDGNV